MWRFINPNPYDNFVGDCTVRAISIILNKDWHETYLYLAMRGYINGDMPSSNATWGSFLKSVGFKRYIIPNECPDCYTIRDFCMDHPRGEYIVATGTHVVAVIDGDYYDTWDSGYQIPIYYWKKEV